MTRILEGRTLAEQIAGELKTQIARADIKPKLAIIQVGNRPDSIIYIREKQKFGERIGALVTLHQFAEEVKKATLLELIQKLNTDPETHGIIIQLPLPSGLNEHSLIESIAPQKDVDGLTAANLKLFWEESPKAIPPATTKAVLALLDFYQIEIAGKKVVVVGNSLLVGKPTALTLIFRGATTTLCHRQTKHLQTTAANADILITATGQKNLITKEWTQPEQILIDVGGDVDFTSVKDRVAGLSPTPGGVGPLTVASLFQNLLRALETSDVS